MSDDRLKDARRRTVGVKQTTKSVQRGAALLVYVAKDADRAVVSELLALCRDRGVPIVEVEAMAELGRACGIEVGASAAAVLKTGEAG
ncbi:MAG: ribosomal L7Ae/L30e/S12e/Gadd45 family protein [Clostridia bacterium]|nr:ribosomal L7Ae/L30e/S12e/Gadd45 family protein [Clostridia bacterium]